MPLLSSIIFLQCKIPESEYFLYYPDIVYYPQNYINYVNGMKNSYIKILFILFIAFFLSCEQEKANVKSLFADIIDEHKIFEPEKLLTIDSLGSDVFPGFSENSVVLENDMIFINIGRNHIWRYTTSRDEEGTYSAISDDFYNLSENIHSLQRLDDNSLILVKDRSFVILNTTREIEKVYEVPVGNNEMLSAVYPLSEDNYLVTVESIMPDIRKQNDSYAYVAIFNSFENNIQKVQKWEYSKFLILMDRNQPKAVVTQLFFPEKFIRFDHTTGTFITHWTGESQIVQFNTELDTLRINSYHPANIIEMPFRQSLGFRSLFQYLITLSPYKAVRTGSYEELDDDQSHAYYDYLSTIKGMMTDQNQNIWLSKPIISDRESWFIIDGTGNLISVVIMPENSRLTHVTDQHLGAVTNEESFELYTNPFWSTSD